MGFGGFDRFFRCGYEAVSGWPGWRAVVTPLASPAASDARARLASDCLPDEAGRFWVDLPAPGEGSFLQSGAAARGEGAGAVWDAARGVGEWEDAASLGRVGYYQAFEQVFEAFEQRVPTGAVLELVSRGAVEPSKYSYDCPGEALLDVSWHATANDAKGEWANFLMRPNMAAVVEAVKRGIEGSGIHELRMFRDELAFKLLPPLPNFYIAWNPNNAGPLYFLVCLTLGVVEDPGAAQEFARSKASARKEGLTGVEFGDIAGLDPILGEVLEVVEFLKDPKTFSKLGARPPKGILLEGDPGTGKTLLAKALAGEAMVPFYQMAGTEFTEGIVGLGAARIRDLFKRARTAAPCVIFVDELDALGLARASGEGNANEEREQTLNQLLTEMDGFTPDTGVPDTNGRYEILRLQLRDKKLAPDVDLLQLARDLPGLVGADLANIVNEAQLSAVRAGRTELTRRDVYAGVDRFTQGELRPSLPTSHRLPVLAFAAKEAGIALVASVLRARHGRIEPVERVSIQPKGRSLSRTLFARGTDEDYAVTTRGRVTDRLRVALAGSAAVRAAVGEGSNFSIADVRRAHRLAEKMVFFYGMSDFGITMWGRAPYSHDFAVGSNRPRKVVSVDAMDATADWPSRVEELRFDPQDPSDVTWHRYQDAVRHVLRDALEEVVVILEEHRDALWAGIRSLAEHRELLGSELRDIFDAHPPRELSEEERAAAIARGPTGGMLPLTGGRRDAEWPYGVEWLGDAYPLPHWVRRRAEAAAAAAAGAAGGDGQQQQQRQGQQREEGGGRPPAASG
ncbi:hypothetical protein Rsub_09119 [Raphidocelis subcapitata]|uniref:AAA+ ATPase domain-containing protein n=1 Tax=Raphidocelis subcapitata TaxID=307507 RepID=A0A2V0P9L8_9CHLO|nr:hypothetical protein Rsub_09119 [Raphidocelis subcapitata]|eukprot:GBF96536.1 hypothetical protein Rsub_09119 [Raphidocelis subcapitata]